MTTQKPKLQGYIDKEVYDRFEAYRQELGLSQSQALEKLLTTFFGDTPSSSPKGDVLNCLDYLQQQVAALQNRVEKLESLSNPPSELFSESVSDSDSELIGNPPSELFSESVSDSDSELIGNPPSELFSESVGDSDSELIGNPPSELFSESVGDSDSELIGNPPSELFSESVGDSDSELIGNPPSELFSESVSDSDSELIGNPPSELSSELSSGSSSELLSNPPIKAILAKGLGQRALAKRLGCSYKVLGDFVILGSMTAWSQRQDPDGLAWELKDKKFYPCSL